MFLQLIGKLRTMQDLNQSKDVINNPKSGKTEINATRHV